MEKWIASFLEIFIDEWCHEYRRMSGTQTNIYQFSDGSFEYLFDISSELVESGIVSDEQAVEDRVVVAFGRSQSPSKQRDSSRMRGFLGPTKTIFGDDYDKGHFLGHASGGGLDVNLFPQRREINRGWSERGKVFREMERYCALHLGTFCFSRPIYNNSSWYPCRLEFGLLRPDRTFWIEQFLN